MRKFNRLSLFLIALILISCDSHDHSHSGTHEEDFSLSYTVWTDKTELFVEFKPLVVGEKISFAAHFSEMQNFKSINEGQVTVSLIKGDMKIKNTVKAPSSPGIFKPSISAKEIGVYKLVFEISTPHLTDKIVIENIEVYASHEDAHKNIKHPKEGGNEISFLKEQAWKMEFATAEAKRGEIFEVIRTGGQILPSQGDEKTIIATTSGIVFYKSNETIIGSEVKSGQLLFNVTGGNLTENNVQTQYLKAKANFTWETSNFERKKELYEVQAISKSEYERALHSFELSKNEYTNLVSNFGHKGKIIKSPSKGFIKTLFKNEGEYVRAGEPLAIITQNRKLTIQADINQFDYPKLNNSISANFLFNSQVYSLENFQGRLLSFGKSVSKENPKIPVFFELDNTGELFPGSFIEVWIKTKKISSGIKIPVTALLENVGAFSVFVQLEGETFEKRDVILGVSDGLNVEIISGVKEGERVVTKGAYQVKMASMSDQVPAHGHSH